MEIKFKLLSSLAKMPRFGHDDEGNAALDFCACIGGDILMVAPHSFEVVGLGVAWDPHIEMHESVNGINAALWKPALIIKGRSGKAKKGIEASNAGVIDSGYRGEICAIIKNNTDEPFYIQNGDAIAQGVPILIPHVSIVQAEELSKSVRGNRGFGSSGV